MRYPIQACAEKLPTEVLARPPMILSECPVYSPSALYRPHLWRPTGSGILPSLLSRFAYRVSTATTRLHYFEIPDPR
jgi:hypothetical protein